MSVVYHLSLSVLFTLRDESYNYYNLRSAEVSGLFFILLKLHNGELFSMLMYRNSTAICTEVVLTTKHVPKWISFCTEMVMYRNGTPLVPNWTCTEHAPTRTTYSVVLPLAAAVLHVALLGWQHVYFGSFNAPYQLN